MNRIAGTVVDTLHLLLSHCCKFSFFLSGDATKGKRKIIGEGGAVKYFIKLIKVAADM